MEKNFLKTVALFDLDGVILDTEGQYTELWDSIGIDFLGKNDFGSSIKGQTLVNIFETHFKDKSKHPEINQRLKDFEVNMNLPFVKGAKEFVLDLRKKGIKTAIVTSSSSNKMESVYKKIPDFKSMFDKILTAEMFEKGKPNPDCYLLGAKVFDAKIEDCIVFEDSFHGLQAGRSAKMKVVGLATTNPKEKIIDKADIIIEDFANITIEQLLENLN
jgi:HAD superfamily hydrolase (TIGR01509 family)